MREPTAAFRQATCLAIGLLVLTACSQPTRAPTVATPAQPPAAPPVRPHWAMKLCNDSATHYAILSTQPPRALDAHRCIDAPFTADDWKSVGTQVARDNAPTAGDEHGFPLLSLQGDDDPLTYVIDPRALPATLRARFDGGQVTLQVAEDRRLYWVDAVLDAPRSAADAQPPGFPVTPTAD